jgi:hypothetical protein
MASTSYSPLSRESVGLLLENEKTTRAWERLTDGLTGVLSLKGTYHPRPLIDEEYARELIAEGLEELTESPFHGQAARNARALEEIERQFNERGPAAELHRAADDYLDALLNEWDLLRFYPEEPPMREPPEAANPASGHRYAAG